MEGLYQNIRNIREGVANTISIEDTFKKLKENHPNDWLLSVEIAELLHKNKQQEDCSGNDNFAGYFPLAGLRRSFSMQAS